MRKPTQNYIFEEANYDGLSNLIIGKSDYTKLSDQLGFQI